MKLRRAAIAVAASAGFPAHARAASSKNMLEETQPTPPGGTPASDPSDAAATDTSDARVSVVIPCYNEERFIGRVLESLYGQYPADRLEIIVVDGMSTDRTREVVAQFTAGHPRVRVQLIDNPARNIPTALNLGIAAARGDVIVRMDAHSIPSSNYVRRAVELLSRPGVEVVGMPWLIRPSATTLAGRSIALAVTHPFGIGDAKYRTANSGSQSEFVDTVPFGIFSKKLWQALGGFNEDLLANEDYDFNYRVRRRGGRVLLDTSSHCAYFARATFGALASQYFRYGFWKAQMLKLHPRSIKLRQLISPVFVLTIITLSLLGVWLTPALWLLGVVLVAYASLALFSASQLRRRDKDVRLLLFIPASFFLIHLGWGLGFLRGLLPGATGRGR